MSQRNVYVISGEAVRQADRLVSRGNGKGGYRRRGNARGRGETAGSHAGWPRLAASCSMFVSGSGHLLQRRWKAGAFYLLVYGSALLVHYLPRVAWPGIRATGARYQLGEADLLFFLLVLDLFFVAALLAAVYSAFAVGRTDARESPEPSPHPLGAASASLLVPGWGQIINGEIKKAMAFLSVVYAGLLALATWLAIPGPVERLVPGLVAPLPPIVVVFALATLGIVVWALSLYDAVQVGIYRRRAS